MALVVLASQGCRESSKKANNESKGLNRYVNAGKCAGCHAAISETYRRTGMANAFSLPSAQSFPDNRPYFHPSSGTWFQIVQKNGAFFQRTWQIGYNGKQDSVQEWKIDYVMGSGNHVRTYLHRSVQGSLVELPLAWYSENGGTWALNPGFETAHPPAGRKIRYDCMFCHNAYPSQPASEQAPGADPVFPASLPEGIDCQRCHGPGQNHVQAAQDSHSKPDAIRNSIVNPKRLSTGLSFDVCRQCHFETTSFPLPNAIRRFDRGPYSFQPGEPLSQFILFFDHGPGTGRENKFEIVSSAYRLAESQCFIKSQGALSCTTCHNPHDIPHGAGAADTYTKVCRQCHATIAAKNHPTAANCISCHMPKRRTEDVVHAFMTDHLIQRHSLRPAAPVGEYHGEVVPYGPAEDLYTALAQVAAKSNLSAGIPRLEAAIAKVHPPYPEVYLEMGDVYSNAGQYEKAVQSYGHALSLRPGSALFLRRLANANKNSGQRQKALKALQKATRSEPSNAEAWYDLGLLQSDLADLTGAIASLRKSAELDPEQSAAHNSLGAVLAESGHTDEAEAEFRAALRIEPALGAAHGNLANLLARGNNLPEAVWHFARSDGTPLDRFNYGLTLARMNRLPAAQEQIEASIKADPNLPEGTICLARSWRVKGASTPLSSSIARPSASARTLAKPTWTSAQHWSPEVSLPKQRTSSVKPR